MSEWPCDANCTHDNDNYFIRLFRGDIPLVITYWVYGGFFGLVNKCIMRQALISQAENPTHIVAILILLVSVAYVFFIWVAVWRSATKYEGIRVWPILAKIQVILGVGRFFVEMAGVLQP